MLFSYYRFVLYHNPVLCFPAKVEQKDIRWSVNHTQIMARRLPRTSTDFSLNSLLRFDGRKPKKVQMRLFY